MKLKNPSCHFSSPPVAASIIIPTYNRADMICDCLNSLQAAVNKSDLEVIVVDSSDDNTAAVVKNNFPEVNLISLDKQTFPGEARNIGVKNSSSEILAFIDSDCEADKNWLVKGMNKIKEGYDIIGGPVKNANPTNLISMADYLLTFKDFLPGAPCREVDFLPSCNLICKKSDFNKIGGFPSGIPVAEDTIFSFKAVKNRLRLLYDPEVAIFHFNRTRFTEFLSHQYRFGRYLALIKTGIAHPGSLFRKIKPLVMFVPLIKFLRIYAKILTSNPGQFPGFLLHAPLIILGILAWSSGFTRTLLKKDETQINIWSV